MQSPGSEQLQLSLDDRQRRAVLVGEAVEEVVTSLARPPLLGQSLLQGLLYLEQVTPTKRDPRRDHFSAKALFPSFTGRRLDSIGAADVRGYIAGRTAVGIAPSTLNKKIALVSAALNWARRELE